MLERPHLNYIPGPGITLALADNPTLDAVNVTIGSTGVVSGTWTWTTTATPATGRVRTSDTATWASSTSFSISEVTADGIDATQVLAAITNGDIVRLQDSADSTKWGRYTITASGTDAGTYWTFPLTYIESNGTPPANNQSTLVAFKTAGGGGATGGGAITWEDVGTTSTSAYIPVGLLDAKGDLIAATAADTAARLAVGSNGQVLTADSAQTTGIKWATPAAGGAGALTLLSTTTLASDGTFDVTGISGAYNDLFLVAIVRGAVVAVGDTLAMRFNGDTGANYDFENIYGQTTTVTGSGGLAQTYMQASFWIPAGSVAANRFGHCTVELPGYASTTWHKQAICNAGGTAGTGGTQYFRVATSGQWRSTAAINRIQVYGTSGNLVTGSQLRIYGRT